MSSPECTACPTAPHEEIAVGEVIPWVQANLTGPAGVVPLVEKVTAWMTAVGYSAADCATVRLALEEALVDGLRDSSAGGRAGGVRVRCRVDPAEVVAEVDGESPESDPEDPDGPPPFHAWIFLCARPDDQGIAIE
jgi:hypothetical protein